MEPPEKIKLCPHFNNLRLIKTDNILKSVLSVKVNSVEEAPNYVITEWEFFNSIITDIIYKIIEVKNPSFVEITGMEMKQYYNDVYDQSDKKMILWGNHITANIFSLFRYREGIRYKIEEDMWYINLYQFLNHLRKEYKKDVMMYGKDFDKPWLKDFDGIE